MKRQETKNKKMPHIIMCIVGCILLLVGVFVLNRYDRSIAPDVIDDNTSYDTSIVPGDLSIVVGTSFLLAGIYNLIRISKNPKAVLSVSSYVLSLLLVIVLSVVVYIFLLVSK